jgi:predicted aspartyl protease
MEVRGAWAGALAGAILLAGPGAASAACSLGAFAMPVTMLGLRPTVTAKVNGQDVTFLVDSGAFFNGINAKFAAEQKLKAARTNDTGTRVQREAATQFSGAGGMVKVSALVQADEFQFAGAAFKNVVFLTLNFDQGGILGQNFLSLMDVEYDFGHGVMNLVRAQDCRDANLAYWAADGVYSELPLESTEDAGGHTVGTVLINGVKMRAIFDTGASTSFLTQRAAARAGVKITDPGVEEAGYASGVDRDRIKTWTARFASVKIGGEEIANGLLRIGATSADSFDILIGADFFLSHHVYVANSQKKIYFTYNGGRVFNVAPQNEAAAAPAGAKAADDPN